MDLPVGPPFGDALPGAVEAPPGPEFDAPFDPPQDDPFEPGTPAGLDEVIAPGDPLDGPGAFDEPPRPTDDVIDASPEQRLAQVRAVLADTGASEAVVEFVAGLDEADRSPLLHELPTAAPLERAEVLIALGLAEDLALFGIPVPPAPPEVVDLVPVPIADPVVDLPAVEVILDRIGLPGAAPTTPGDPIETVLTDNGYRSDGPITPGELTDRIRDGATAVIVPAPAATSVPVGSPSGVPSGAPGTAPVAGPSGPPMSGPGPVGSVALPAPDGFLDGGDLPGGLPGDLPGGLPGGLPGDLPGGVPGDLTGGVPGDLPAPDGVPDTAGGFGMLESGPDGSLLLEGPDGSTLTIGADELEGLLEESGLELTTLRFAPDPTDAGIRLPPANVVLIPAAALASFAGGFVLGRRRRPAASPVAP